MENNLQGGIVFFSTYFQCSQRELIRQLQQLHCARPKFDQLLLGKVLEQIILHRQLHQRNFLFLVVQPFNFTHLVQHCAHAEKCVNHEAELAYFEVRILMDVIDGIPIDIIFFADSRQRAEEKVVEVAGMGGQNLKPKAL
jgi:hypothetical protein